MTYCICGGLLKYIEAYERNSKREYCFECVECEKITILEDYQGKIKVIAYS